jgi:glycosyltransferase involved in cell wall biosynthesis
VKRKGALDLLVAFLELGERGVRAKVTLVGSDSEVGATATLRAFVADHDLADSVKIIPRGPHLDMPAVYQTGTIFCLPSYLDG